MYPQDQAATHFQNIDRRRDERTRGKTTRISTQLICGVLPVLDAVALLATATIAYATKLTGDPYSVWTDYAWVTALGVLLALNLFHAFGLYDTASLIRPGSALRRTAGGWLIVSAFLIAVAFLTKTSDDYSRGWALLWLGLGMVSLIALKLLFFRLTAHWAAQGQLQSRLAIVGWVPLGRRIAQRLTGRSTGGAQITGIFSDRSPRGCDGDLDDLVRQVRRGGIDAVMIALPLTARQRFEHIVERLADCPVDIRLCPGHLSLDLADNGVSYYCGVPALNVADKPFTGWRAALKEVEDRLLGSLILVMISPILLVIAGLIKLDSPGPVFFRQKRFGFNNQLIEVLKFRTMRQDMSDQGAAHLTRRNDPRITPLGSFLRRHSLDELPQFINVVAGEMSIVGPRPHAVQAKAGGILYYDAVDHYDARHRVKPGITGWAQINGWRGTTDTLRQIQKRVEYDLYYIENWSLWLDLKIILMTAVKGFGGEHAY